jgi:argininosuccinate lyase
MNQTSRLPGDAADELPRELIELGKRITMMPAVYQRDLEVIYGQVVDSVRRRRRILALVQEALAQLRLDVKYLMFDLEVTRQERDSLRERLGEET